MLSPRGAGGGETPGISGAFDLYCLLPLTKNLGPRVWTFAFCRRGMGPRHIRTCARLCAAQLGIEVAWLKP